MKTKKGFTLIELLAVIAILAILVVLAIPNILKIFTSSKKEAFGVQVRELYKSAEQEIISKQISNPNTIIKKFDSNEENKKISLSGTQNVSYCIKIENNKITSIMVSNGDYWYSNNSITTLSDILDDDINLGNKRVSCDENGTLVDPIITLTTDQGTSGLDTGDTVTISKGSMLEQFYVISTNTSETVLLAKYNLLVGDIIDRDNSTYTLNKTLSLSDSGYGLQSSAANAWVSGKSAQYVGVVPFSGTNYWDDGSANLISPYNVNSASYSGSPYPNVYNGSMSNTAPSLDYTSGYGTAQNNGYTIAYYVEKYINKLGINGTGRLLKYEEEQSLASTNSSIIFNGQTYWLGSAYSDARIWFVTSNSSVNLINFSFAFYPGVRPVIVVNTSDIQTNE